MQILDIAYAGQTWRIHCRPAQRRNRYLRLTVSIDGKIYLSQPLNCRQADIHTFIHTHLDWLAARARSLETQATQPSPYAAGSKYWLLGEALRLVLTDGAPRTIRRDGDCLITAPGDEKTLATAFRRFHLAESAARFPALVAQEAARCPWVKTLPPLRYRAMQRRWGCCRSDGMITLNTRLIQYPPALIAYVIVHELCHLQEHNHSPAFYALMQTVQPDWQAREAALRCFFRENGALL